MDQKRFLNIFPFGIIDDSEAYLLVTLVEVVIKYCYRTRGETVDVVLFPGDIFTDSDYPSSVPTKPLRGPPRKELIVEEAPVNLFYSI